VEDQAKGFALGADGYCVKPLDRADLTNELTRLTHVDYHAESEIIADEDVARLQVLIIDDDPAARYVITKLLKSLGRMAYEAPDGVDGIRSARQLNPDLVLLDLNMPGMSGFEVLDRLKADPLTQAIPVAIVTSASISEAERRRLEAKSYAIVSKSELSGEQLGRLLNAVQRESMVKHPDSTSSQMPL
jgi:CheY-like chemotaxis protein